MVLESHLLFGGDGRGGDVLSSNPLAATSPGANKLELFLVDTSIAQSMEPNVHGFCAFWLTRELMMPSPLKLSVWRGVGDCGCPITSKIFCSSTPLGAFVYNDPISALASDDMTALIMEALFGGLATFSERK
jgi:hypothetical protein